MIQSHCNIINLLPLQRTICNIIIIVPPYEEGLQHHHHCSSLRGWSTTSSSFLLLTRKVYNIIIIVPPYAEGFFEPHQAYHRSIQTLLKVKAWSIHQKIAHRYSHTGSLQLPYVPYRVCKNTGYLCAFICHGTLGSLSSLYNSGCHIESLWCPNPCQIGPTPVS